MCTLPWPVFVGGRFPDHTNTQKNICIHICKILGTGVLTFTFLCFTFFFTTSLLKLFPSNVHLKHMFLTRSLSICQASTILPITPLLTTFTRILFHIVRQSCFQLHLLPNNSPLHMASTPSTPSFFAPSPATTLANLYLLFNT